MVELTPDCENCAGLCCVALAFDRSEMFAFNKAAGEACPNLSGDYSCGIHQNLEKSGFKGCVQYGCDGAGQRVVQEVFGKRSWRSEPALLPLMQEAFAHMRAIHAQLVLIKASEKLLLSNSSRQRLEVLAGKLQPAEKWSLSSLREFVHGPVLADLQVFWRSVREEAGRVDARG